MMKKICKTVCLGLALSMLALPMVGCEKDPGLYAWYGGKMDVDNVMSIHVNGAEGEKVYDVSFDTYRTVFVYLKNNVSDIIMNDKGEATALSTNEEKNLAIKEVAEDILTEYYALTALCEKYGISITDADREKYYNDNQKKIQDYVDKIEESDLEYEGTKEEYASELYEKSLAIAGMTPEYYEFSYYRSVLETKLRKVLAGDLGDYLSQSYYHYKQVLVSYTKGDAAAEENARRLINEAKEALLAGEDIDTVIKAYGDANSYKDVYFDTYGKIVASSMSEALGTITVDAVCALQIGEYSDIISGDNDEYTGYFAILKREGFDEDHICGTSAVAKAIYSYPYVGATYLTPHASRFELLLESYLQNTAVIPTDEKVYDRIAINTLY